jgi:hypothetical protein
MLNAADSAIAVLNMVHSRNRECQTGELDQYRLSSAIAMFLS